MIRLLPHHRHLAFQPQSRQSQNAVQKSFTSICPVIIHLQFFSPGLVLASMLLLNRVRKCARRKLPNLNFLRRKRCFSGGTDTSRRLLRPCGTHRALPDGDRRKKRGIDFATQKHTSICPYGVRFQRIKHRIGEPGAIQRSLTLKMRFKSLAAARNWVRIHPETRPAKSPRAPAAATPSFFPHSHATGV